MSFREIMNRAARTVAQTCDRSQKAVIQYVTSNLKKDAELVRPSLALVGRVVRAGANKVSSLWGEYGPGALAEKAVGKVVDRPVRSAKISRQALLLTGVAGITVIGAAAAFVLPTGVALLVTLASAIGNLLCGTEHLTALREEVGPAIHILLWLGTILLFCKSCLGFKAAAKDLKDLGKLSEVWEIVRSFVRNVWNNDLAEAAKVFPTVKSFLTNLTKGCLNAVGAVGRFISMGKALVMSAWRFMISRTDGKPA